MFCLKSLSNKPREKNRFLLFAVVLLFSILADSVFVYSQATSGDHTPVTTIDDTTFIFTTPRPLIIENAIGQQFKNGAGIDLLLSNSGFGFGV